MAKQLKRPNHAGSVYKLSGRRRNPWAAMLSSGYDKNGKRTRKAIGYFATKTEALKALAIYDIAPTERPYVKFNTIYEEWSVDKYPRISKSLSQNYEAAYKKLSPLHNHKFRDLRTAHFQMIINEYEQTHSRSSLNHIKSLLGQMYKYAMMNDIVHQNYAKFIILPKQTDTGRDAFTDLEVQSLFKNDSTHIIKAMLLIMYLGFRISVSLGLTVFDYNAEEKYFIGGNKTEAGKNRIMPVPSRVQPYLDYFLSLKGQAIICQPDGTPYKIGFFRNRHYEMLESLEIRRLPPHCYKHTYATMLSRLGTDDKTTSMLTGHANPTITREVYIHKHLSDLRKAVDDL